MQCRRPENERFWCTSSGNFSGCASKNAAKPTKQYVFSVLFPAARSTVETKFHRASSCVWNLSVVFLLSPDCSLYDNVCFRSIPPFFTNLLPVFGNGDVKIV